MEARHLRTGVSGATGQHADAVCWPGHWSLVWLAKQPSLCINSFCWHEEMHAAVCGLGGTLGEWARLQWVFDSACACICFVSCCTACAGMCLPVYSCR